MGTETYSTDYKNTVLGTCNIVITPLEPAGAALHLGFTVAEGVFSPSADYLDVDMLNQAGGCIDRYKIGEGLVFAFSIAEVDLTKLKVIWDQQCPVETQTDEPQKTLTIGGGLKTVKVKAEIYTIGPNRKFRKITIFKATFTDPGELRMEVGALTVVPCTLAAMMDPDQVSCGKYAKLEEYEDTTYLIDKILS